MTHHTASPKNRPLRDDDDLRALLEFIVQSARRRQVWLLFIDDRDRLTEPLVPIDGYPADPHAMTVVPDLGEVTEASLLLQRAEMMRDALDAASVVIMWERPGARSIGLDDREWATAMRDAAFAHGIPLRAQYLLHSRGVRQIQVDDLG
ncbi:hypothetical protein [Microbacterium sp. XT11]|uniref:hypothetical protein n=1 Tax=Microbacterium sp. XT11 TaxID=367477 RepID=UPI000ADD5556|nr:hypothetical protein [Microbacterium sp. XT11]